jgi:hypothetical protein
MAWLGLGRIDIADTSWTRAVPHCTPSSHSRPSAQTAHKFTSRVRTGATPTRMNYGAWVLGRRRLAAAICLIRCWGCAGDPGRNGSVPRAWHPRWHQTIASRTDRDAVPAGQDHAGLVGVPGHLGLLPGRPGGGCGAHPAAHGRRAGQKRRRRAGLPARLCHHWPGAGAAPARQPDRLAVRGRRVGLVAADPRHALGGIPAPRRPPAAAGRPAGRHLRGRGLGARHQPGRDPAVAAAARGPAALAPLAAGGRG